jgi:DNA polymerase-3 subunit gamma/tau
VLQRLQGGEGAVAARAPAPAASSAAAPTQAAAPQQPGDFAALVKRLEDEGKALLALKLRDQVGVVRFAPGELVIRPLKPLGSDFARDLATALKTMLGTSWAVSLSDEDGEPSLHQQEQMAEERARAAILAEPNVAAVLAAFPGASLENVITKGA